MDCDLGAIGGTEFRQDVSDVDTDGAGGHSESASDFGIREAGRNQLRDFLLAWSQPAGPLRRWAAAEGSEDRPSLVMSGQ